MTAAEERLASLRERLVDAALAGIDDYARLVSARLEHIVPVQEPLVLISQVQRCGGTLLSQLFDGHPNVHAHPYELHIGHPAKEEWPQIDLQADSDAWFEMLREPHVERAFAAGYSKQSRKHLAYEDEAFEVRPFMFPPSLQRVIFTYCVAQGVTRVRDVLDAYMTAYFNAWLDNQNLYSENKRWVTGFVPRLGWGNNGRQFFEAYPDGRLISVLRDPTGWFASARVHNRRRYGDLDEAIELWSCSTREMLEAVDRYGERVCILSFEALVRETEPEMRRVADWLGIEWQPMLAVPTFNRFPIKANSSYRVPGHGVLAQAAERGSELARAERREIERRVAPLHREALELIGPSVGRPLPS